MVVDEQFDHQVGVFVIVHQLRGHIKVTHSLLRFAVKVNVAVNAGKEPHILIFKVRSVGIAVDHSGDLVFAGFHKAGHIEFVRGVRTLGIAHTLPVEPNLQPGLCRAEEKIGLPVFPTRRQGENGAVGTDLLIFVVDGRNILPVDVNGVRIGIRIIPGLCAVLLELPDARNVNVLPGAEWNFHVPFKESLNSVSSRAMALALSA